MSDWLDAPTSVSEGGVANLYTTNERPIDMHKKVMTAFPALTPIISILTKLSEDTARNVQIDHIEENQIPTKVQVAAALTSSGTTLTLSANAKTLVKDTVLYNVDKNDSVLLDSTPTSDTSCAVTRDVAGATGVAWVSGDICYVLPPALAENDSTEFRDVSVADSRFYNLMQLVKLQYSITRVGNRMTTHFGGPGSKREQLKRQKFREVRIKWEQMVYFGGRATSGSNESTKRMSRGLTQFLRDGTLYKNFNGIITESGFRNFLGDYKDQNPDATEIMLFAAGNVLDRITDFGRDAIRIDPSSEMFGLDILRYKARGLMVKLVALPLLTDPTGRGYGYLLDLDRIGLKTLDRLTFFPEAKNVGESEVITDTYRVVTSMLLANESRHAMFVGAKL